MLDPGFIIRDKKYQALSIFDHFQLCITKGLTWNPTILIDQNSYALLILFACLMVFHFGHYLSLYQGQRFFGFHNGNRDIYYALVHEVKKQ